MIDQARRNEIENSIIEGELILKTGQLNGRKFSLEELEIVKKSVNNAKKKINATKLPAHLQEIINKQKEFEIIDVTPEGYGI